MLSERCRGKVALISGVARGQGRAHAVRLASEGASIVGFDALTTYNTVPYPQATEADLKDTINLVESAGGSIIASRADVRARDEVESVVADGIRRFGKIDVVVANAGIGIDSVPFWEVTQQQWDDVLAANLTGVWHTVSAAAPAMISTGSGGSVIITSSAAAQKRLLASRRTPRPRRA